MTLLLLADRSAIPTAGGPCILPVMPLVCARRSRRAERPACARTRGEQRRAGGNTRGRRGRVAVAAGEQDSITAIVLLAFFGITRLFHRLSGRLTHPHGPAAVPLVR